MKFLKAVGLTLLVATGSTYVLAQSTLMAYPNPFETVVHIQINLVETDTGTLELFSALGQNVATIFTDSVLSAGPHSIVYDGSALAPGVYVLRLQLYSDTILQQLVKTTGPTAVCTPVGRIKPLSPNPTCDRLFIPADGPKTIFIFHQGILTQTVRTDQTSIGLGHLRQGIYILTILDSENRLITTQKILKSH